MIDATRAPFPSRAELERGIKRRPDYLGYEHPLGTRVELDGIAALLAVAQWALDAKPAESDEWIDGVTMPNLWMASVPPKKKVDEALIEYSRECFRLGEARLLPPFRDEVKP